MKKFILFFGFTFMLYSSAEAQSWIDRVGKSAENAAKRAVENRVERKTDETVNKTMDKVEESEKKKGKKSDSKNQAEQQIREPSLASYFKFDFVPGEKVIFFDDFSSESIGDFPLKWFTNGSGEVVQPIVGQVISLKSPNQGITYQSCTRNLPTTLPLSLTLSL